ncbi:hypothetical protein ACFE04_002128 [Oxalis oulophora]
MGNCLVLQEKVIRIIKSDGNVLQYIEPLNVEQLLSEFTGHAISETFPDFQYLRPDVKLLPGQLYYLVPLPLPAPSPKAKKKVRFADEVEDGKLSFCETKDGDKAGVMRIKLVITKQQLEEMLQKGPLSIEDMVSKLQSRESVQKLDDRSLLESIPEVAQ